MCTVWRLLHTPYDPVPHNHSQHNQCRTPYSVIHGIVLHMMGIMMPETCWGRSLMINIGLVASCWFISLHPTHHHARSQEPKPITNVNTCSCSVPVILLRCRLEHYSAPTCIRIPPYSSRTAPIHQYTPKHSSTPTYSRRLLRMNVITFETCWAIKTFIKWHQVGSISSTSKMMHSPINIGWKKIVWLRIEVEITAVKNE